MIEQKSTRPAWCWPTIVIWLTVFATLTLPGRETASTEGAFDAGAKLKIAVRLLSIAVLGWVIFSRFRSSKTRDIVFSHWPWIAFAAWAIVSVVWTPLRSVTLGQAGGQVALIFLSVTIAMAGRLGEQRFILNCVLAATCYCAIYGIGAIALPGLFNIERSSRGIVHPTALGATASLGAVLVTSLLLTTDRRWVKPLAVVAIPTFAIALLVANNRLSIALVVVVCLGIVIAQGQLHRMATAGVVVALTGVFYLCVDPGLVLTEGVIDSSAGFLSRGQSANQLSELSGRSEMWAKMWQSFLESPIIGHGYFVCSSSGTLFVWTVDQNHTAHNLVLQALVSSGIVGLTLFVVWNLQVARVHLKTKVLKRSTPLLALLGPAVLVWFLGWSMLNASLLGPVRPESAIYAVIVGMVIGQLHDAAHDVGAELVSGVDA